MPAPLILASTSPYRRALLERLGVPFAQVAPGVDEDGPKALGLAPEALAAELARRKAHAVAAAHPGAIVVGSDQLAEVDGARLDKPGDRARAAAQLRRLAGREHRLWTAVHVVHPDGERAHVDLTRLTMRPLEDAAIERYLDADAPFDCAGSYKLEARGVALFERVDGADASAVTGLPLLWLGGVLRDLGLAIP